MHFVSEGPGVVVHFQFQLLIAEIRFLWFFKCILWT